MTNHPRRVGRRKHQRQAARSQPFSPFPCHVCRGHVAHLPGCLAGPEWTELTRSLLVPDGTRVFFGPAQGEGRG